MRRTLLIPALAAIMVASVPLAMPAAAHSAPSGLKWKTYHSSRTVTVPSGACIAEVIVDGGQGGTGGLYQSSAGGLGGSGAAVQGRFAVQPKEQLKLLVGEAGRAANGPELGTGGDGAGVSGNGGSGEGASGGGGGGASAIETQPNAPLVIAGGGGGGGAGGPGGIGGAGGTSAHHGSAGFHLQATHGKGENATGGGGATSKRGGAAGTESAAPDGDDSDGVVSAKPGSRLEGGDGASSGDGGGGGGGGLYGGGGAGASFGASGGGGGGGSSLVPSGGKVTQGASDGNGEIRIAYPPCKAEKLTLQASSIVSGYVLTKVTTKPKLADAVVTVIAIRGGKRTNLGTMITGRNGQAAAMWPEEHGKTIRIQADIQATSTTRAARSHVEKVHVRK